MSESRVFTPKRTTVQPVAPERPEATALLSAHIPISTKDRFDHMAFHMKIKKRDLLCLMIDAYAQAMDEQR
jgi:hypothetical protein